MKSTFSFLFLATRCICVLVRVSGRRNKEPTAYAFFFPTLDGGIFSSSIDNNAACSKHGMEPRCLPPIWGTGAFRKSVPVSRLASFVAGWVLRYVRKTPSYDQATWLALCTLSYIIFIRELIRGQLYRDKGNSSAGWGLEDGVADGTLG